MSTETVERTEPALSAGPIRCASWCADGTGHADEKYRDDQWCRSISASVVASLEAPAKWTDGTIRPAAAGVYAERQGSDVAALVTLVNHNDQGTELTPEEARDLAGQLVHFAWVAEQDGRERNAFEIGRDCGPREVPA